MDYEQSSHATHAMELVERHQPWEMLEDMALDIIDRTYAAALEIVGRGELKDGVVELKAAVHAADPDSPVLTVHASPRHCCVAFNNPRGDALPYRKYTSPKQKMQPCHRLARAFVSVSPGTLFLSRVDDAGPKDHMPCSDDARPPDAAAGGVFAILDAIVLRLGAAIRLEEALLVRARASGCKGPKVDEILIVRNALDKIRSEMDLPALMRRIVNKRRDVTEITCRPAAAATEQPDQADETERLMKKLRLKC
ncbi:hypothetical protein E2562_003083 [Oryza meyeriana var. granulata]|uniref:Uncharacterized protein n=1 Tax=Oryza meyeriana var. granulata TaxID=110450 RepID=A0A6G1E847_9ORYZ|nr:hypothetical protein E2562_003083 [Oryza meyeriana var. granulata]